MGIAIGALCGGYVRGWWDDYAGEVHHWVMSILAAVGALVVVGGGICLWAGVTPW